jgi:putative protease
VPLSVLGKLRREMVRQLDASVAVPPLCRLSTPGVLAELRAANYASARASGASPVAAPELHVLCRSLAQVEAVLACGVRSLMADFRDVRAYRRGVDLARTAGAQIYLATPRIQKPAEFGIFRALLRYGADGILVRNLAGMRFYAERHVPFVADFALNAANDLTVHYLRRQGAARVTASYDLNREQLLDLVAAAPAAWLEVVIHQHMPLFHMEHCVFCAWLSPGTNRTNCGRPCDRHAVQLRDRIGMAHLLTADVGCRNTLFNAVPQSAAEAVPALLAAGVRHFRVELLEAQPPQIAEIVTLYRQLLAEQITGKEVWRRLQAANRVGVTRGTLEQRRNPLAIL